MAFDHREGWPALPSLLRVWVSDVDDAVRRAIDEHATVVTAPANSAFGQRGARIRDPFGNMWWITAQIEEVAVEPAMARLAQPQYAEQMRDAQETLDRELSRQRRAASPPRR